MKDKYVTKLEIIRDELNEAKTWGEVERVAQELSKLLDEVE